MDIFATAPFVLLSAIAGFAWAIISYEGVAESKGWPVGAWFVGISSLVSLSFMVLFLTVGLAAFLQPWWMPIVAVGVANIVCRTLFLLFGAYTQSVSLAGLVISGIAIAYYFEDFQKISRGSFY
ncbi:MAG: hypothetical protein M0Q95_20325 [Porticoccaceae bacterium]|nr:hypothetical protein [Porticoccaceae bacterium]